MSNSQCFLWRDKRWSFLQGARINVLTILISLFCPFQTIFAHSQLICSFSQLNFVVSFYTFAIMYCVSMLTSLCIMGRGVCACVCAYVCVCVYMHVHVSKISNLWFWLLKFKGMDECVWTYLGSVRILAWEWKQWQPCIVPTHPLVDSVKDETAIFPGKQIP